jgi:hypothetical protein
MSTQLTTEGAKQSLNSHVEAKGCEIFAKYGPQIGWSEMQAVLNDRSCVRYPCTLDFDASWLQPGEFAYPEPKGEAPEEGFTLYIHPHFLTKLPMVPHLVLYQLVRVNYGEFASSEDAETFAASALGLDRELYYQTLCSLADELGGSASAVPDETSGHACSCGQSH